MHRFHLPDMTCGGCLGSVTRAIGRLDPQARIEGDLETRNITVESQESTTSLLAALREAGYSAQSLAEQAS